MAKQYQDIYNQTRTLLDETTPADWKDAEVLYAVNYAYQDVVGKVMEVYEAYYETITPFTYAIQSNVQEYEIDNSLLKVTRVEINYSPQDPESQPIKAASIKSSEMLLNLRNMSTQGSVFSAGYYLHGPPDQQYIGFVPIPQQADTTGQSISVWGIQAVSNLVNFTDPIRIPFADRFGELIEYKAASKLLSKGQQDEASATKYKNFYDEGIMEMQTYLKIRQQDGPWMIESDSAEDLDFSINDPW
jgi:hypothetical protein